MKIQDAIAAYSAAARAPATSGVDAPAESGGSSFSSMLKDAATNAVDSVKQSEQASKQAIAGKTDIREVVNAVSNAELTLETVVAVRDKVINAYNEILRMPI